MKRPWPLRAAGTLACAMAAVVQAPAGGLATLDFRVVVREAKDRVFPAVVFVKCVQQTHQEGKRVSREVSGSGVLISADGELLTNWHVVDKATEVRCLLYDGQAYGAQVVGVDKDLDIALLRLRLPDRQPALPFAALADSRELDEGDFVMAMGAPWGLARSVSIGIVSCTRRFLTENSEYSLWLQTDAAISPGNSGGPLINTDGDIVGINTLGVIFGGDMGFAVPSATIREILPRLRHSGDIQWSWTGLRLQPLRDFQRNVYFEGDEGVIVAGIDEHSPAREAGIQERDRILSIGATAITARTDEDLPDIRRTIALLPVGEPVLFVVRRGKKTLRIPVTLRLKGRVEGEELDCPRWDLTVKAINQFENPDLHFFRKQGVFVFGVRYPGNAAEARLVRKDVLLEIDGREVTTLDDVRVAHQEAIANVDQRSRVLLKVLRNGIVRQVVLEFSRDYERE